MSMQDPISDMIARVKNAQSRGHKEVLLDPLKLSSVYARFSNQKVILKKSS